MTNRNLPVVLLVLDGWGHSDASAHNAVRAARTPVWDRLWSECPHTLLRCSGAAVGLPSDQMGNSEVGHLNLGAGRVVYQEFTRVSRSVRTGSFFNNAVLTGAVDHAVQNDRAVHILGLLSPGGVHSHEDHIHAMTRLAVQRGAREIYIHAFLDGRDTPPKSAESSLRTMEQKFAEYGAGRIASVVGRYYAMDRDHRWPRIQAAYDLITEGIAEFEAPTAIEALRLAYARGETDEFVQATRVVPQGAHTVRFEDGDTLVFMNYRSDRARQITRPFIEDDFNGFERRRIPRPGAVVSLTEYKKEFCVPVAFPPERMDNVLGEYLARLGMHQLRVAETEKYAHVTFFFNGGREAAFSGEDRILVPSPQVATYDLQPEMSAPEVADEVVKAVESGSYEVVICNFANADMVGHTGRLDAAVAAIEAVDECAGRILAAVRKAGGELLITADHGNAEQMQGADTDQPHTAHTTNPVPLVYMGRPAHLLDKGSLADVAPSMLHLLGVDIPPEMTGRSLVEFDA